MQAFRILFLASFFTLLLGCGTKEKESAQQGAKPAPELKGKRILMVIAPKDFRDEEYRIPREVFEKAGAEVTVASASTEKATGMLGMVVKPDILLEEVKATDYDALVFVGGVGARQYWEDPAAHRLIKEAYTEGKVLGAICIAPVTLANAGVLKGRRATVFFTEANRLKAKGAIYTGEDATVAGKIITGNGPKAARKFAQAVVNLLASGEKSPR